MDKITIFALPYAGGTKAIYKSWEKIYSSCAEVVPIEYSGHGSRFCEQLYDDANDVVEDVFHYIIMKKPTNYIIYGHSMGSVIAVLLADKLEREYKYPPKLVAIGGRVPPDCKEKKLSSLPKEELLKEIFQLGQTDDEIMNNQELVDILYEIFRADIHVNEKEFSESRICLKSPLFVATGLEDYDSPVETMKQWRKYTTNSFSLQAFKGNHFFPFNRNEFHDYFSGVVKKCLAGN